VVGDHAESDVDLFLLSCARRAGRGQRGTIFLPTEFFDFVENGRKISVS